MEKISIVHYVAGRKTRHGYVTVIGDVSFCVIPAKAEQKVYFGIPGVDNDFLQVYAEDWATGDESVESAIDRARIKLEKTLPSDWVDDYSRRTLEEVRKKKPKWHRDYLTALLADYKVYHNKDWKPA